MDEKIKSSFSEYKINYNPASSYLTGGTIQTSIPYAANQANNLSTKVDEMDLTTGLDKFNSTINNHNDIKVSEATILKIQIEEFNDTKVMIEEQLKELELKYNEFMVSGYKEGLIYENNICYNPDSLRASGYQLDIYLAEHGYDLNNSIEYQKGKEEFEKWIDEVYIPLFDKYFSEELGMTFEEYKELILALKDDLAIIKSSVYAYEQQEKLLPYLEIIETEEYKAYLESTEVPTIGTINSYFVMVQQEDLWLYNKLDAASEYLTEDDYYILKYLCDNKGIEHINAYLDAIEDRLNQSKGMVEAQAFIDSISTNGEIDLNLLTGALMAGKGIVDGIENFFEGLSNVFSTEGMISSNQYAQMYILEALGQEGIMDDTYQLGIGLGNMLPSIAISVLSQGALSGAGVGAGSASKVASVISSTSMGISSFGNDKNQGLIAGNDLYASTWHGIFTGLSETSLGLLLGNIPGLNSDASLSIKGLLSEGLEEGLQEYVGAGLNAAFYGEDIDISQLFGEGGKSFLYGMILSGFTNSTKLSFKVIANGKSVGVNANNFGAFISIMNDNNVGVTTLEDGTTTFIINSDTDVDSDLVSKMEGLFPSVAIIQQKNYGITNTIKETVVNSDIKFRTQIDGDSKEQSSHYLKTKVGSMEQPENITWGDIYNDPDITQPRVSVSSLLNIIKNPIEFKKSSTFENGIRKMDYYNYLVQLVDAVVKNDYDLDLSEQELGNLSELWHEALQVLPISCISYQEYLPDDIKLKLMLENGKIYNIEDVSILSKDFHEKFNSENFNSFPGTVLSDRFEVYLDLLIKYFENSSNTDLTDEILDFYYELLDIRKNCINLILEKKGDVSEANFTKFLSNIGISFNPNDGSMNISGFDSQMVLDYVNYYTKNSNYDINYTINPRELSLAQLMFWVNGGYIDGLPTVIDNIPTSRLLYALYEGYATIVDNGYGSAVASLYKIMQERGYEQILNDGALEVIKKVKKIEFKVLLIIMSKYLKRQMFNNILIGLIM